VAIHSKVLKRVRDPVRDRVLNHLPRPGGGGGGGIPANARRLNDGSARYLNDGVVRTLGA